MIRNYFENKKVKLVLAGLLFTFIAQNSCYATNIAKKIKSTVPQKITALGSRKTLLIGGTTVVACVAMYAIYAFISSRLNTEKPNQKRPKNRKEREKERETKREEHKEKRRQRNDKRKNKREKRNKQRKDRKLKKEVLEKYKKLSNKEKEEVKVLLKQDLKEENQ